MKAEKKGLGIIGRIFLWINIFLCIALLISYAAPTTDPAIFWPVAFFGLAYPFLLLINFIFLIFWIFRRSLWLLLPLICIAAGWSILTKTIGFHFKSSNKQGPEPNLVRMMTYNVHNFKRFGSKNDISTKNDILDIINQQQPDIIGFQEFYSRWHGQYDMVDTIQKMLHTKDYYFEALQASSSEAIGMAMFSKYPIVAHGFIQLANDRASENQCLYIDVKKGDKTFRVYSVHLQSIRFDPEDYKYLSRVSGQGKVDMGSNRRLGTKLKNAFIKRSHQVFKIRQDAAKCPYPYIISGDFNDTPTSFAVNEMAKGLKNAFTEKGQGLGRTYNGSFPNYQIDYIMASPAFDVLDYNIIEKRLSDHYPVCSDLVLK
jgi:endonuclease/exonuclease/phosphatase family metal-dependent hydrolase